ncbi:dihydrofolate reductase [Candidatus Woesearchaeota archaeon]|nr:dihydrofolate reductase [Candidatus Woesearchaeota archaeon]
MIAIIAALTRNRVIGKDNKLPWHIAEDLQNFKKMTIGNTVIMGRKTYESIGKPLPNRNNIVVSRTMSQTDGVLVCQDIPTALEEGKKFGKDIYIVGGTNMYEQTIPFADKMYLSYVKGNYPGNAYFPEFDEHEWVVEKNEDHAEFNLVVYARIELRKNAGSEEKK